MSSICIHLYSLKFFTGTSKQYMTKNSIKRVSTKISISISLHKLTIPAMTTTEKGKFAGFLGNSHVSYLFRSERSNQNLNWQQFIFTQGWKVYPHCYFSLWNSLNYTFPTSIDKNISSEAITLKNPHRLLSVTMHMFL